MHENEEKQFLEDIIKNKSSYMLNYPKMRDTINKTSLIIEMIAQEKNLDLNKASDFNECLDTFYQDFFKNKNVSMFNLDNEEEREKFYQKYNKYFLHAQVENDKLLIENHLNNEAVKLIENKDISYNDCVYNASKEQIEIITQIQEQLHENAKMKDEAENIISENIIDVQLPMVVENINKQNDEIEENEKKHETSNEPFDYNQPYINEFDFFKNKDLKVEPNEVFAFIDNKDELMFPFNNEDVFNLKFAHAFYATALNKDINELRNHLENLKAKNAQLRKMLDEKDDKIALAHALNDELKQNSKMTDELKNTQIDEEKIQNIINKEEKVLKNNDEKYNMFDLKNNVIIDIPFKDVVEDNINLTDEHKAFAFKDNEEKINIVEKSSGFLLPGIKSDNIENAKKDLETFKKEIGEEEIKDIINSTKEKKEKASEEQNEENQTKKRKQR